MHDGRKEGSLHDVTNRRTTDQIQDEEQNEARDTQHIINLAISPQFAMYSAYSTLNRCLSMLSNLSVTCFLLFPYAILFCFRPYTSSIPSRSCSCFYSIYSFNSFLSFLHSLSVDHKARSLNYPSDPDTDTAVKMKFHTPCRVPWNSLLTSPMTHPRAAQPKAHQAARSPARLRNRASCAP